MMEAVEILHWLEKLESICSTKQGRHFITWI
jgi:hypothetical protein